MISSSRDFILGFVDLVSFSTPTLKEETSEDVDSIGDLTLIEDLTGTL